MKLPALALAVGLVLADSSVVTLGLPDVLREFDAEVAQVAWVLTAYNLVLALAALPAARIAQGRSGPVLAIGLVVFGGASALCAVAPSLGALIAARCVQALGGAAIVTAALEQMVDAADSERRGIALWGTAGIAGAALGPAIGGVLTGVFSWQAIFVVQVPLTLAAGGALAAARVSAPPGAPAPPRRAAVTLSSAGRPHVQANLALLALSAALTAALFLLVLLLIEGWLEDPAVAGFAVSVMPAAALAAGWVGRRIPDGRTRIEAGTILIAGGLAALGLMPEAGIALTVAPQVLIGLGLGLTVSALTDAALRGRSAQAIHGGWTIAARHAGVVVGLLLLTPIFTADLEENTRSAKLAGTALIIDSGIAPLQKVALGRAIASRIEDADGRLPDLELAFAENPPANSDRDAQGRLRVELEDQIARAATDAFSTSFLVAAGLALLALVPIAIGRGPVDL